MPNLGGRDTSDISSQVSQAGAFGKPAEVTSYARGCGSVDGATLTRFLSNLWSHLSGENCDT